MPSAKDLIKNAKADLGWEARDPEYTAWRLAVKEYCTAQAIVSKSRAGDAKWGQLLADAPNMTGFKPTFRQRIIAGSDHHVEALEALLSDVLKKTSETKKNLALKRVAKRPREEAADEEEEDSDAGGGPNPVALWIADPGVAAHKAAGQWVWDNRPRRKLGVLHSRTLNGIWDLIKLHIPANRKIREIFGALENPAPANPNLPADWTRMTTDAEVDAFLMMTNSKPIRLLAVMHRIGAPNSPPPVGATYFAVDKFDPPEEFDDPAEDSDALRRNAAGVAPRRYPTVDHSFEDRKLKIRARIRRQQELLSTMKRKHKEKFPNAGQVDSEDEGYAYVNLLRPKPDTGAKIVKARGVVRHSNRIYRMNIAVGATRGQAMVRAIRGAQNKWEELNQ